MVLAAVVIAALVHALDPSPIIRLWRLDRDQYSALAATLSVLVAELIGSSFAGTRFSPPITVPARAGTTFGLFAVPLSITATTTPCPRLPPACKAVALIKALLKR